MPEDAKGKEDAQQSAIEVAAGGSDKTKSVVMILIILSVLVMVCTPVVTIFAMKAMISSQSSPAVEAKTKAGATDKRGEYAIKNQQCIIGNSKGTRYVKLDVVVLCTEPAAMDKYFKESSNENPEGLLNRMKAEINRIIMGKQLEELDSPPAIKNLGEEIKDAIKNILPKDAKGTVIDVYFPNFLIS